MKQLIPRAYAPGIFFNQIFLYSPQSFSYCHSALHHGDVSDVSHTVPTIMLSAAAMCKGTPLHHWATTAQVGMSIGQKGMFYAAECMAEGAWQLVTKPEILNAAWDEFRKTE